MEHPLPFRQLPTRPTGWDLASAGPPTLNVRLDGCIVPSEAAPEGARVAHSHLLVLDDFIGEEERRQLLEFLIAPDPEAGDPPVPPQRLGSDDSLALPAAAASGQQGGGSCAQREGQAGAGSSHSRHSRSQGRGQGQGHPALPPSKWERRTADMAGGAPTWGVRPAVLAELARMELPAMREVHARLAALLPHHQIALLPSDAIQRQAGSGEGMQAEGQGGQLAAQEQQQQQQGGEGAAAGAGAGAAARPAPCAGTSNDSDSGSGSGSGAPGLPPPGAVRPAAVDCAAFVANAAVEGDGFAWHVDADPTSFPSPSPWVDAYGDYFNGEPGKPLLASLMLYLNPVWQRDWGGETLFLDAATDCGVFVRPRPRRAVLFTQDTLHRVSAPAPAAGGRPRFSLVWKLALLPRAPGQAPSLAAPGCGWGPPAAFGSAARVDAVMRQLAGERKRRREGADEGDGRGAGLVD